MLVLAMEVNDVVWIGDSRIVLCDLDANRRVARIGFEFPPEVNIVRESVMERMRSEHEVRETRRYMEEELDYLGDALERISRDTNRTAASHSRANSIRRRMSVLERALARLEGQR